MEVVDLCRFKRPIRASVDKLTGWCVVFCFLIANTVYVSSIKEIREGQRTDTFEKALRGHKSPPVVRKLFRS